MFIYSFDKFYEGTRGRHCFCKQRSEDLIYNDNIKRILINKGNVQELKKLAEKQKKLLNNLKELHKINKFNNNSVYKNFVRQQRKRSLGKLESVDNDCDLKEIRAAGGGFNCQRGKANARQPTESSGQKGGETLTYYLQLATDYYEQGFLKNIKYLQNVGERNHYRRKRQLQLKQQHLEEHEQQQQKPFISSNLASSANILTPKSYSLETEQRTDVTLNCSDIKRQIKQTTFDNYNSIDLAKHQQIANENVTLIEEYPLLTTVIEKNCSIRVNIKPQTSLNAFKNTTSRAGNIFNISTDIYGIPKDYNNSMNDYLNGNYQQQQQQEIPEHLNHLSVNNYNYPSNIVLIDNLIDNLRELDLQENHLNLPRITLTDCSPNYNSDIYNDFNQHNSEKITKSIILKPSKLDKTNLAIPSEQDLYQSESRPP